MYSNASAGEYSYIGRFRYYSNFTGDPDVLVGYKELCFNIAEAIERGWTSGSASTWYQAGIQASMTFYGINTAQTSQTAYFLPPGANSVTQVAPYNYSFNWDTYYAPARGAVVRDTRNGHQPDRSSEYIVLFENSGKTRAIQLAPAWAFRPSRAAAAWGTTASYLCAGPIPLASRPKTRRTGKPLSPARGFSADDLNQTMWLIK